MSEKVVLPKEVAEAIKKVWENEDQATGSKHVRLTNWERLRVNHDSSLYYTLIKYAEENPIEYMTALVDGYTVERTKEERLLEYYEYARAKTWNIKSFEFLEGFRDGIEKTLRILEIPIPGINDKEESE